MKVPALWRSLRRRRVLRFPLARATSLVLLAAAVLVLLAFLVPLWVSPTQRSVAVSATTQKATIVFSGPNRWLVDGARLCEGLAEDCNAMSGRPFPRPNIEWQDCDVITVIANTDPEEYLIVLPTDMFGLDNPTLHISTDAFAANGAQPFSGYLEIGALVSSGSDVLLTGDFSFYDRDMLATLAQRPPDVVKTGAFRHGDAVSAIATRRSAGIDAGNVCADAPDVSDTNWVPQAVFGHFGIPANADDRGFAVTATSPATDVGLQVKRFGRGEPLIISPVWVDVVIASPAFLAVTILLTYLATVLQLLGAEKPARPDGKPQPKYRPGAARPRQRRDLRPSARRRPE